MVTDQYEEEESDKSLFQLEEVGVVPHCNQKQFVALLRMIEETGKTAI